MRSALRNISVVGQIADLPPDRRPAARVRRRPVAALLLCGAALLFSVACRRGPEQTAEVVVVSERELPSDPVAAAWDRIPEHVAKMIPQDLVEPRVLKPTTGEVRVRAVSNGTQVAFRLEWDDPDQSDTPGPSKMIDSCAIQIPEKLAPEPPDPQMGGQGKTVQVAYWRADWQAIVNGRGDSIRDLYPRASIDHYPHDAKPLESDPAAQKEMAARYNPARALGNDRGGPRRRPVEDLVADGPGTLAPAPSQTSSGKGVRTKTGWSVVIQRNLPAGLAPRARTHVAFAVWQGSQMESGARKMRTGWIPLLLRGQ
jgi:DMSO reductase family type II enzyme heme b subunit